MARRRSSDFKDEAMRGSGNQFAIAASLLLLGTLFTSHSLAGDVKIGTVNFVQLLEQSPELIAAMLALRNQFEPRRQELLKMQSDAKANPGNSQLQRDFTAQAGEFQREASTSRDTAVQKVMRSIIDTIHQYAKAEDIDLVLGDVSLLAEPPLPLPGKPVDITAQVQAYIAHPTSIAIAADPNPPPPEVKIALYKGLSAATKKGANLKWLAEYASKNGYALVLDTDTRDTVYFSKPQFKVTDITSTVPPSQNPAGS
jgi:Skp family chaperone for outer membrane proteins